MKPREVRFKTQREGWPQTNNPSDKITRSLEMIFEIEPGEDFYDAVNAARAIFEGYSTVTFGDNPDT